MRYGRGAGTARVPVVPAPRACGRAQAPGRRGGAGHPGRRLERGARRLARSARPPAARLDSASNGVRTRPRAESRPRSGAAGRTPDVAARQGCRRAGRAGRVARQVQVRPHLPPHESQAAPARAHQGEHVLHDGAVGRRVLDQLGVVLSIYVHEMGHVQALQRYGIKATAPMFIPGVGAVVRLKQYPADRREDARVGLAGPIWGLGAAVVAYAVYRATGSGIWGAIAHFGAWVNLFNLLPVWQLDGGRGFRALTRGQRWIAAAMIGAMWLVTGEGLLVLLGLAAAASAGFTEGADQPDPTILVQYGLLVVLLSLVSWSAVVAAGAR